MAIAGSPQRARFSSRCTYVALIVMVLLLAAEAGAWKYWPAVLVLALDLALAPSTLAALTAILSDLPFTAVAALAAYL